MWFVHAFNKGERYCLEKHTIGKHMLCSGEYSATHTSQGSVYRHAGRVLACAKPKVSQPFRKETWGTWTAEKVKAVEKEFDDFMATDDHALPAPLFGTMCFHR